jgi:2-polyprenyl-3-methyl-5-hydroxy-6-metoxy-1,4-benzoquinol methylase/ribosomal protein S27E
MKEQEIRSREAHNRYLELVRLESEKIFQDKSNFLEIACPACGSTSFQAQFEKYGFVYVQCSACDTLFLNPRPAYQELMRMYADSEATTFWVEKFFTPMAEARRVKIFQPRAAYIAALFPELASGRIGDIGSGFGIFTEELLKVWPQADITAIEPSHKMADLCRKKGIKVLESMLEDLDPAVHRFDLLTAFELFEHLSDPGDFLEKVKALLNPGGHFFFTTLNGLGFDIQIHWERSKSIFPPVHLNFFNPRAMEILLARHGLDIVEVSTPGELDWDIVEGGFKKEGVDPGRFFRTMIQHGTAEGKQEWQRWLKKHNFSSHLRVICRKPVNTDA